MRYFRLGRTNLQVSRVAFGCIPIQRLSVPESTALLRLAFESGVNFYDTARAYTTSESRLAEAFGSLRDQIFIATKTMARDRADIIADLETSLANLKSDYVDIFQLHNPPSVPQAGDEMYDALVELRAAGKIRFIGFTNHNLQLAIRAADSGAYDTVQYPLSLLAADDELKLPEFCASRDVGLIAMKAMAGGLIDDARAAFAFIDQYPNVLPIWGVQHEWEMAQFLEMEKNPPALSGEIREKIRRYRDELAGAFCRGCGYCLPCPAGIPIPMAARMSLLLRRMIAKNFLTAEWRENMAKISQCVHCDACKNRCPYHLDTPNLLAAEWEKYQQYVAANV